VSRLVVDTWPMVALAAGSVALVHRGQRCEPLWRLCNTRGIQLGVEHVQRLINRITVARELWTTHAVLAEAWHRFEADLSGPWLGEVHAWLRERLPEPHMGAPPWSRMLAGPTFSRFGVADTSVMELTRSMPGATLLLQDTALQGWCLEHGIRVQSCLDVMRWSSD
jgi:hypothetical protein